MAEAAHGLVFKVARTFAPSDADRDDLVQEILLQLRRSLPRFGCKAQEIYLDFTAWLQDRFKALQGRHRSDPFFFLGNALPLPSFPLRLLGL